MSSSTSRRENLPLGPVALGPRATLADSEAPANTRERLSGLAPWAEQHTPEALDLSARMLEAMQVPLNGHAGRFADNGIEEHGRAQVVRGDQHMRLLMLCRLLVSNHPKAQAAADAFLDIAAAARGKYVTDVAPATARPLGEHIASVSKEVSELIAALCAALAHGDAEAADRIEDEATDVMQVLTAIVTTSRELRGKK